MPLHLNRFDLNLLIALDALLREKSVTRAAERLCISQPAMSVALQKLRDYFDDPLLVRLGRDMELTPCGLSLIEPVREALLRIQATLGTKPSFDPATVRRSFTIIVAADAAISIVSRLLQRLTCEAPGIQCHFERLAHNSLDRLEYGDADLCLLFDSLPFFDRPPYPESLRSAEIRPMSWVCAADINHPDLADGLTKEQYLALPHVFARPSGNPLPVEHLIRRVLNVDLDVRATAQNLFELAFMLPGTPLIATLPERLVTTLAPLLPLKKFPVPFPFPQTQQILLWHKRNEPDPGHAWLRSIIIDVATNA